ncbi:hypothetical protein RRG08_007558 [Elysia crispata]|uniref:protein-tyrosine-phosphatase n=1 Tax=Elysia crispata TaxID=231223 RepID=A0AAE1DPS3_9GAST|nr:hypothetical protein RRG08_007558 [Elysia crispata]
MFTDLSTVVGLTNCVITVMETTPVDAKLASGDITVAIREKSMKRKTTGRNFIRLLCGCLNGTYGDGCEIACSDHCAGDQNSCHHVSGACDQGCDPGYRGSLCLQECPAKTWGDNCSQECSTRCDDSKCHHVTGTCVCLSGFWGFFCKEATVQLGIILGAVVIALIICAIIVGVCLRRRRKAQEKDDISLCEAAASVGDQDRHEPSRISEAGAFQTDSHNDRKNMDGDRVEDMKLHREENMEKDRVENMERKIEKHIEVARVDNDQDGVLSNTAVPVQTLNTYIRQHATDSHFLEEFSSVPMVTSSPRTAGLSPQNVKKNRYKNIIPYNSTRVLLQRDHKKNQSDYINASYVKVGKCLYLCLTDPGRGRWRLWRKGLLYTECTSVSNELHGCDALLQKFNFKLYTECTRVSNKLH